MTALDAGFVFRQLTAQGFGPFVSVPCSYLAPLITWCERNAPGEHLAATNEGEAVALAAGAHLAGRRPVVLMQNSGLGNAVNPLTSLCATMRIPLLLLVTWRGRPGQPDEPQHRLMGGITRPLIDLMGIGHQVMSGQPDVFTGQLATAGAHLAETGLPYALVVPKGALAPVEGCAPAEPPPHLPRRRAVIADIMRDLPAETVVLATTGRTGRELEADWDRPGNLYVVGSMGCASSIGLGIALHRRDRPLLVLDGDGAALMRLEAMVSVGAARPDRLVHVLLDNSAYESTGSQRTHSGTVDFPAVALACGYRAAEELADPAGAGPAVRAALGGGGPRLIRVPIATGSDPGLGRPANSPEVVAGRLRDTLLGTAP